jgi:dGTPase
MWSESAAWLEHEAEWLAPYALPTRATRGRRYAEPESAGRTAFQRDRDRLVHSTAFRRLVGKTQVMVASVNDHHRTRLTHTLEVAGVARSVARRLRLNDDLAEVIALAHDLGHPPFGHAGEEALNECLRDFGGFEHNLHGLRRVDVLEDRYPQFLGLNLSYEVREALALHNGPNDHPDAAEFASTNQLPLEAQLVDVADSLTYDAHDLDDALGVGLIMPDDVRDVELYRRAVEDAQRRHPGLSVDHCRAAVVRTLIDWQVCDLIDETRERLSSCRIRSLDDVRAADSPMVGFSNALRGQKAELEAFLRSKVYRHHRVLRMTDKGKRFVRALFTEFVRAPHLLPARHALRWHATPRNGAGGGVSVLAPACTLEQVVTDYVAGMTDRFAQQEYQRLFQPSVDS